jgi:hypothetical protein
MTFQGRNVGGDHLPGKEGIEDEIREKQGEKQLPGDEAGDEAAREGAPASEADADE